MAKDITEKEWKLLEFLREIGYGRHNLVIFIENNEPVRIDKVETRENIKL